MKLSAVLVKEVRTDIAQSLTTAQKDMAQKNIGISAIGQSIVKSQDKDEVLRLIGIPVGGSLKPPFQAF